MTSESNKKRRRPENSGIRSHPWQRRKMRVPAPSEEDSEDFGAYGDVYDDSDMWKSIFYQTWQPSGVLPSSQILSSASSTAQRRTTAPILQKFMESVGLQALEESEEPKKHQEKESLSLDLEELDDPSNSNLTPIQHRRYLRLSKSNSTVSSSKRWTPSDKKHWKQLKPLVQTERRRYQEAMKRYWEDHQDRILMGFSSKVAKNHTILEDCANWAAKHQQHLKKYSERLLTATSTSELQNSYTAKFGKCRQMFHLQTQSKQGMSKSSSMDISELGIFKVLGSSKDDKNDLPMARLPEVGTTILSPIEISSSDDIGEPVLLRDDKEAIKLAAKHKVTLVATNLALEALMRLPGKQSSQWNLVITKQVLSKRHDVLILDDPLVQAFQTPRECLTRGIEESLYQQSSISMEENHITTCKRDYAYSLWTLPKSRKGKSLKLLVRSPLRFMISDDAEKEGRRPCKIRAHLEYFPERGKEVISPYEGSLWILDQLLWNHQIQTQVARIDARNCKILDWEETSMAYALVAAGDETASASGGPFQVFVRLVGILEALPTIDFANTSHEVGITEESDIRLLCLPGRQNNAQSATHSQDTETRPPIRNSQAVSVHAPIITTEGAAVVDITKHFENADTVRLSAEARDECRCLWRWEKEDQIEYTFPPRKDN